MNYYRVYGSLREDICGIQTDRGLKALNAYEDINMNVLADNEDDACETALRRFEQSNPDFHIGRNSSLCAFIDQ